MERNVQAQWPVCGSNNTNAYIMVQVTHVGPVIGHLGIKGVSSGPSPGNLVKTHLSADKLPALILFSIKDTVKVKAIVVKYFYQTSET